MEVSQELSPVEIGAEPCVVGDQPLLSSSTRGYGSIELVVIGLLAALLVVLAVPVIRIDDENQALKTIETIPTTVGDLESSL